MVKTENYIYVARMIDETSCVSAHRGVNDICPVDTKHVTPDTLKR